MEQLAMNGGRPVREEKLSYGRQWIDAEDVKAVCETLESDYLTCGPKVPELERYIASYTGAGYAAAVSSGTAALHCACIAAGIGPGDEVITTPLTFAASANCALYCGAKPVFADIDLKTYTIDPDSIRACVTNKTKAIVAVDYMGQAVNIQKIREICEEYHLVFIEDAAHSIGTKYNGRPVGSLADMTCFSFHPVKTVTSGEGGMVTVNDRNWYEKLLLARTHGITRDASKMKTERNDEEGSWYYEQTALGYNYRMTDFQAALLLSQMKKLDRFAAKRKKIVTMYNEAFSKMSEIMLPQEIPESDTCRHLYTIRLDLEKLTCTRKQFFDAMAAENIQCQVHYIPVYWFPYYEKMGYQRGLCPNVEYLYHRIMSIPLYPKMTDQDVHDVIHAVQKVVGYYRKL